MHLFYTSFVIFFLFHRMQTTPIIPVDNIVDNNESRIVFVDPSSYKLNNNAQYLYRGPVFPIYVILHEFSKSPNSFLLTLSGVNEFNYKVECSNGTLCETTFQNSTSAPGTPEQFLTEGEILDVFSDGVKLEIDYNYGNLTLINSEKASEISFGNSYVCSSSGVYDKRLGKRETRQLLPGEYVNSTFPIYMNTVLICGGVMEVSLRAANIAEFFITYDERTGAISKVGRVGLTRHLVNPRYRNIENTVWNGIANAKNLTFNENGNILKFSSVEGNLSFGQHYSLFDRVNKATTYWILPETYMEKHKKLTLFSNQAPFKITIQVKELSIGKLQVTLNAVNTAIFNFHYNNASGDVISVHLMDTTIALGVPENVATETRVRTIFANAHVLRKETEGDIFRFGVVTKFGSELWFETRPLSSLT